MRGVGSGRLSSSGDSGGGESDSLNETSLDRAVGVPGLVSGFGVNRPTRPFDDEL